MNREFELRILKAQAVDTIYATQETMGVSHIDYIEMIRPYRLHILRILPIYDEPAKPTKSINIKVGPSTYIDYKVRPRTGERVNLHYRARFTDWKPKVIQTPLYAIESWASVTRAQAISRYINNLFWNAHPKLDKKIKEEIHRLARMLYNSVDFQFDDDLLKMKIAFLNKWAYDERNTTSTSDQDLLFELCSILNNQSLTEANNTVQAAQEAVTDVAQILQQTPTSTVASSWTAPWQFATVPSLSTFSIAEVPTTTSTEPNTDLEV